jgi:undecaprenyl diphosphate synthase
MTDLPELPTPLPKHVAIIMDGNGRWAKKRYLPREAGHYAGMNAVRETVRAACDMGLENLTLFAFSSENWKRPKTEVGALMGLFRAYFRSDMDELVERNVRMRIIGHRGGRHRHPADDQIRKPHRQNDGMNDLASTGGQKRSPPPPRNWRGPPGTGGWIRKHHPELFAARLFTSALPAPDQLIRSGEHRLSNSCSGSRPMPSFCSSTRWPISTAPR